MRYQSENRDQTESLADGFIKSLKTDSEDKNTATVVGLYGDLGSGKTTFVQGVGKAFNLSDRMVSPTFVIEKIYKLENEKWSHLIHIDAYRIEKSDELIRLGWNELVADPKNIIFIEWPEMVADIMPENHIKIHFTFIDEHNRAVDFENYDITSK